MMWPLLEIITSQAWTAVRRFIEYSRQEYSDDASAEWERMMASFQALVQA